MNNNRENNNNGLTVATVSKIGLSIIAFLLSVTAIISNIERLSAIFTPVVILWSLAIVFVFVAAINIYFIRGEKKKDEDEVKSNRRSLLGINATAIVLVVILFVGYYFKTYIDKFSEDSKNVRVLILPLRAYRPNVSMPNFPDIFKEKFAEDKDYSSGVEFKFADMSQSELPFNYEDAKEIGYEYNADIVIWGSYEQGLNGVERVRQLYTLTEKFSYFIDTSKKHGDTDPYVLNEIHDIQSGNIFGDVVYIINWAEGMSAMRTSDFKKAQLCFEKANKNADQTGYANETFYRLGLVHANLGDYKSAIECLNTYTQGEFATGDSINYIIAMELKGFIHCLSGEYPNAWEVCNNLDNTIPEFDATPSREAIIMYSDMGLLSMQFGLYEGADKYMEQANHVYDKIGCSEYDYLMVIKYNQGIIELSRKHDKEAIDIFNDALDYPYGVTMRYPVLEAKINNSIGNAYAGLAKLPEGIKYMQLSYTQFNDHLDEFHPYLAEEASNLLSSYTTLDMFDSADYYRNLAKKIYAHNNNAPIEKYAHYIVNSAELFRKKKKYQEALSYDYEAMSLYRPMGSYYLPYATVGLAMVYEETNNTDSSMHYLRETEKLLDSYGLSHDNDPWSSYFVTLAKNQLKSKEKGRACSSAREALKSFEHTAQYEKDKSLLEAVRIEKAACGI